MAAQRAQALADAIRTDGLDAEPTLLRHAVHVAASGLSRMARNGLHPDVCEALLAEVAAALDIAEDQ